LLPLFRGVPCPSGTPKGALKKGHVFRIHSLSSNSKIWDLNFKTFQRYPLHSSPPIFCCEGLKSCGKLTPSALKVHFTGFF
jgi:hypothetical protein